MKNTGTLRIQTFAARQSAPVEGVTVTVQGDGFTLHRITDTTGLSLITHLRAHETGRNLVCRLLLEKKKKKKKKKKSRYRET